MNFFFGKDSTVPIKFDQVEYEYYYYNNLIKMISTLKCMSLNTIRPPSLDACVSSFLAMDAIQLKDMVTSKFALIYRGYAELKLGAGLTKLVLPYKLDHFPLTSFITSKDATVYLLYDLEKVQKLFNKFLVMYSLYTSNIENIFYSPIEKRAMYTYEESPYAPSRLENPLADINRASCDFTRLVTTKSTVLNTKELQVTQHRLGSTEMSLRQPEHVRRLGVSKYAQNNLSEMINSRKPNMTIASFLVHIMEAGLGPIYAEVESYTELYMEQLKQEPGLIFNPKTQIKPFSNSFKVTFQKAKGRRVAFA